MKDEHAKEWLKAYSEVANDRALEPKPTAESRTIPLPMRLPPVQLGLPFGFLAEPQHIVPAKPSHNAYVVQCRDVVKGTRWHFTARDYESAVRTRDKQLAMGPNVAATIEETKPRKKSAPAPVGKSGGARSVGASRVDVGVARSDPGRAARALDPIPTPRPAKARAESSDGGGRKKEPAGHVWWVSERWTKAHASQHPPAFECKTTEALLNGLVLENANGQNRGSMGAMHAHFGREKKRKDAAMVLMKSNMFSHFVGWPVRVTLTRIAPVEVDDDNLKGMFKRVRDGICEALGFRDDKPRDGYLAWDYKQEKGGNKADNKRGITAVHHVRIRVEVLK